MIWFYLAAPFELRAEAAALAEQLEALGLKCSSRWLTGTELPSALWAKRDIADLLSSDVCIVLNPESWSRAGTGGRHVEFGYALAARKPVVLVGDCTNIFHHLANARSGPEPVEVAAAVIACATEGYRADLFGPMTRERTT